jgi:hypothetical protein
MAAKKKAKGKSLSKNQKEKIQTALKKVETNLLSGYKSVASSSGKSLSKGSVKIKKDLSRARKKIEAEVKKNPAGAAVAAAVLGAVAGALLMSKLRKK